MWFMNFWVGCDNSFVMQTLSSQRNCYNKFGPVLTWKFEQQPHGQQRLNKNSMTLESIHVFLNFSWI